MRHNFFSSELDSTLRVGMIAVSAFQLSKRYKIYERPADQLKELFWGKKRAYHKELWALRNIDLEIKSGSTMGLIGDNGAGKTTLLKILAGTTMATSGFVNNVGRVSAILDLGVGFHHDFSGLDNIYLNGSLLGLSKREIDSKIGEIVEFSELGDFIYQPVRTYSTGMFLRLAFSVAISIEPDILLIDEVLAVGDQRFQKKCVDKILGFQKDGKTIIFCSHDLYRVRQICDRTVWLEKGKIREDGGTLEVTEHYFNTERFGEKSAVKCVENPEPQEITVVSAEDKSHPEIDSVRIVDAFGAEKGLFHTGENLDIEVNFRTPIGIDDEPSVAVVIFRDDNVACYGISTEFDGVKPRVISPALRRVILRLPNLQLLAGSYKVTVLLTDRHGVHIYDRHDLAYSFSLTHGTREVGLYRIPHQWA